MAIHFILLFLGIILWIWLLYTVHVFCKINHQQKELLNSVIEDLKSIKDEVKDLKNKY